MGLDITAYSKLERLPDGYEPTEGEEYDGSVVRAFAYSGFPHSFRGIPALGTKALSGGLEFIEGPWYRFTAETETLGFGAGRYVSYSQWRDALASFVGHVSARHYWTEGAEDWPFFELISFSDNEGTIGPEAARDLLEDFRAWRDRYYAAYEAESNVLDGWYRQKYDDWTRACELAADGGLIDFH